MSITTVTLGALRYELAQERIARQRAETRLADCQRQLSELRRERDWAGDSGLHWSGGQY